MSGQLTEASVSLLLQLKEFIEGLDDEEYVKISYTCPNSTIGLHARHTLDHYRLLIEGMEEGNSIKYDNRHRLAPEERDRSLATALIESLVAKIRGIHNNHCPPLKSIISDQITDAEDSSLALRNRPLIIQIAISHVIDDDFQEVTSSYGRELWFVAHHAIHHAALIRCICVEFGISVPHDFGVAPSTRRNWDKSKGSRS